MPWRKNPELWAAGAALVTGVLLAWLVATSAMLGSLYFSEVENFAPIRRMLDQPLVSMVPGGLGPFFVVSDFDKDWSSSSLTLIFPYMRGLAYLFHLDRRPARERRRVMGFYREMVRRQIHLYGGATLHCSKNPTFVLKMRSVLETFPDARFVYMVRHPDETIPSLLDVMGHYWHAMGTDPALVDESVRLLGELVKKLRHSHGTHLPLQVTCFDQGLSTVYKGTLGGFSHDHLRAVLARRALGASDLHGALSWAWSTEGYDRLLLISDGVVTAGRTGADHLRATMQGLKARFKRMDAILIGRVGILRNLIGLPRKSPSWRRLPS